MEKMTKEWCKETETLIKWHKDRIPLLEVKIGILQVERDALQRVVDFAERLIRESQEPEE